MSIYWFGGIILLIILFLFVGIWFDTRAIRRTFTDAELKQIKDVMTGYERCDKCYGDGYLFHWHGSSPCTRCEGKGVILKYKTWKRYQL